MAFTFFFRDQPILESAIQILVKETMGRSRVRVWDAGCAMGPEPYTLLMLLAEKMGRFAFNNLFIDATDHDESGDFGSIIEKGHYHLEQLQRIPTDLFAKYFKLVEGKKDWYEIDRKLRDRLRFRRHDLLSFIPPADGYAMILCKNVLLHFTPEQRIIVLQMFHSCLASGGLLVTEHTQKMPDECSCLFEQAAGDAQIFRKRVEMQELVEA